MSDGPVVPPVVPPVFPTVQQRRPQRFRLKYPDYPPSAALIAARERNAATAAAALERART